MLDEAFAEALRKLARQLETDEREAFRRVLWEAGSCAMLTDMVLSGIFAKRQAFRIVQPEVISKRRGFTI